MAVKGIGQKRAGLLPHEFPGLLATIGLGFQHFIAIFPATVLVPILTGFNVSVTLFASGLATMFALMVNKSKFHCTMAVRFQLLLQWPWSSRLMEVEQRGFVLPK